MEESLYDALSSLVRQVYTNTEAGQVRTVLVTATDPSDGVSYLSTCMSTLIAENLGHTVIVEGQLIERLAQKGLLPRRSDCTQISNGRLWVLGTEEVSRIPLSVEPRPIPIGAVIEALSREFDYVVVDTPALSESQAAEVIAPYVDGAILVATHNTTELQDLAEARVKLTARGGNVLGAIYNTSSETSRYGVGQ